MDTRNMNLIGRPKVETIGLLEENKPFSFRIEVQASLPDKSPQVYHITSVLERIPGIKSQELKTIYWKENIEAGGA